MVKYLYRSNLNEEDDVAYTDLKKNTKHCVVFGAAVKSQLEENMVPCLFEYCIMNSGI